MNRLRDLVHRIFYILVIIDPRGPGDSSVQQVPRFRFREIPDFRRGVWKP